MKWCLSEREYCVQIAKTDSEACHQLRLSLLEPGYDSKNLRLKSMKRPQKTHIRFIEKDSESGFTDVLLGVTPD